MKHLKSYKIFESRFSELKEVISTIKDICQEFEDNNCSYDIEPSNDIRIKVMALQGKGEVFQDINMPFYLEINIKNIRTQLPEWFIETCKRIEDFMSSEGFETLPSVKRTDWENLDTVDELEDVSGLIQKVKLEFIPNEVSKDI
jgi:hypothetical protein